jgi:hypothetical protein
VWLQSCVLTDPIQRRSVALIGSLDSGGDAVSFRPQDPPVPIRVAPIPVPIDVRGAVTPLASSLALPGIHSGSKDERQVVDRVRGEFLEMPGLSPTLPQAARLFAMPADQCHHILSVLVREGFLRCSQDGQYRRN